MLALQFDDMTSHDLQGLSREDFDRLPFGAILLDRTGTVKAYNLWESKLARRRVDSVLGKNFFLDVAPCTDVAVFRGKLQIMVPGQSHVFDYQFDFPWGRRAVRIRFLVESMDERWVFVTDVT
jgi:photoactive yellow protein